MELLGPIGWEAIPPLLSASNEGVAAFDALRKKEEAMRVLDDFRH